MCLMKKSMRFVLALCATLAAQAAVPCFTVTLNFAHAHWTICVDGVQDDDMPPAPDSIAWPADSKGRVLSPRVNKAAFSSPARVDVLPQMPESRRIARPRSKRAGCCEKGADLLQYGQPERKNRQKLIQQKRT